MNGFSARCSSTLFIYNINKHLTLRTLPVIYIIFSMTVTVAVQRGPAGRRLPYQPRLSLIVILSIYYPVFKSLMGALDTKSLVSLSNTSRGLRSQVQFCEWNINTRLTPFVVDPQAFRSILGASEALIYGDFATEFFSRTTSKTLAIMAKATKADPVQAYLGTQGYELAGEERVRLGSVTRFRRGELFIILRKTRLIPIQAILSRTPTTQAMNFIAWNKAYSVFPKTTFLDHEVLPLKGADKDVRAEIARCGEFGWCLGVNASPHQELSRTHRRIGDSRTWKMDLDTLRVTQPGTPTAVLEYSSFGIQQPTVSLETTWYQLEESLKYSISVKPLTSQVLKYRYTCSRQAPPEHLRQILKRHTLAQMLYLMPKTKFESITWGASPADFDLDGMKIDHPPGWSYKDHILPGLWASLGLDGDSSYGSL